MDAKIVKKQRQENLVTPHLKMDSKTMKFGDWNPLPCRCVWKTLRQKTGRVVPNLWPMALVSLYPTNHSTHPSGYDLYCGITKIYQILGPQYYRLYTMICKERIMEQN